MMPTPKKSGQHLAADFMALDPVEFRLFWAAITAEWNDDDSDLEAQWFYLGRHMRERDGAVIRALLAALAAGMKEPAQRTGSPHGQD